MEHRAARHIPRGYPLKFYRERLTIISHTQMTRGFGLRPKSTAVSLADLTKVTPIVAGILIGPVCPNKVTVNAEPGRGDGAAVLLECPEDRASAIVDTLRARYKRHEVRCYEATGKTWKRI